MRNSKRESDTGIPAPLAGWNEEDNEPSVKMPNTWHATVTREGERERETERERESKYINCTHSVQLTHTYSKTMKSFPKRKKRRE